MESTTQWRVAVHVFFVVAVGGSFHTLVSTAGGDWVGTNGFSIIASAFALVSSLTYSKSVRDWHDADALNQFEANSDAVKTEIILAVARGSTANFCVCVAGFAVALGSSLSGLWMLPEEQLSQERKGFILIAILFLTYSAFSLAKLTRDSLIPALWKRTSLAWCCCVVIAFILAIALSFGGVEKMTIAIEQKRFFQVGMLFILATTISLAKMVRDRDEHDEHDKSE